MKQPPIRTDGTSFIEIDQRKDRHPFLHVQAVRLDNGKLRWAVVMDSNEGGQIVGEGQGISMLLLSDRKMRALRDFLNEMDLGD